MNTKVRFNGAWQLLQQLVSSCLILFFLLVMMTACRREVASVSSQLVAGYDLKQIAGNFVSPLGVVAAPDSTKRLFVIDQVGKIWIIGPSGTVLPNPFIDVSSKMMSLVAGYDEHGLLGLAFHPKFNTNHKFYLFYTAPPRIGGPAPGVSWNSTTRISEFKVSTSNPDRADLSTERVILESDHPLSNHNGGMIAFGPDGFLYIAIGDGGGADDAGTGHVNDWYETNAGGNAQNIEQNLLGKILRIDVDHISGKTNYSIPIYNPFVGITGLDEIYAFGFRNPFRFSFDMGGTHQLFAGDVGQGLYEEIDLVYKGGNYGWNVKEGNRYFNTSNDLTERPSGPTVDNRGKPLINPVIQVRNFTNPLGGETNAIVGGYVYRGTIQGLSGKYIFGFFSGTKTGMGGKIMISTPSTSSGLWSYSQLTLTSFPDNLGQYIKGFGQDLAGEVYITTSAKLGPSGVTGKVYKIVYVQ